MLRFFAITILTIAACSSGRGRVARPAGAHPATQDLLAADRAYSAAAERSNLVIGTLQILDDSVVFVRPGPGLLKGLADVREYLDDTTRVKARVTWSPHAGHVAANGVDGYTFGSLDIMWPDGRFDPGRYIAYWRNRNGVWRVVAYRRTARVGGATVCAGVAGTRDERLVWRQEAHDTAGSGDLGYSVGVAEDPPLSGSAGPARRVRHLCIWRRAGRDAPVIVVSG